MAKHAEFLPYWASPPGQTILDLLGERSVTVEDFATRIGFTVQRTHLLLDGEVRIDAMLAHRLSDTLGASETFWINRDEQYCADLERSRETTDPIEEKEWLRSLPISDMSRWGWISVAGNTAKTCFDFFEVRSVSEWRSAYGNVADLVAFRKSTAAPSVPPVVAAWLRKGEIEATKIKCASFDPERLRSLLPNMRSLTMIKEPREFLPKLVEMCASAGVAFVIVRAPARCGVSGAARFVDPNKGLVQLSFRYRSDDHFWFTFFHELAHLLLHGRDGFFIEGQDLMSTHEEEEANAFSGDFLIPPNYISELQGLDSDFRKVMRFARRIGVSAGIVVGQMQHRGILPRNHLNKLKVRYVWTDEADA